MSIGIVKNFVEYHPGGIPIICIGPRIYEASYRYFPESLLPIRFSIT